MTVRTVRQHTRDMSIFVVFRVSDPAKMGQAVARVFPQNHLSLKDDEWLISYPGTVKEVSDKLELVPGGQNGAAMVFSMASYFGTAEPNVWEWIRTKAEFPGG